MGGSGREEDVGGSGQSLYDVGAYLERMYWPCATRPPHPILPAFLNPSRIVCGGYLPARYTCLLQTTDKHKHADAENGERE